MTTGTQKQRGMFYVCFTYLDILTYIKGQTETKMQHEKFDN